MAPESGAVLRLARRLRSLREDEWSDVAVTQADLAKALSTQTSVAPTTISSWESLHNPKTPGRPRLISYALFFSTRRSMDHRPHLVPVGELNDTERALYDDLRSELLALHGAVHGHAPADAESRVLLSFSDAVPVVVICPNAPPQVLGALADEDDVNYNRLHRYADTDALIEVFGHLRALNPTTPVLHRLSFDVQQGELQNHLVLLGGIAWNRTVRDILKKLRELPVEQISDRRIADGEPFRVKQTEDRPEEVHLPVTEEYDGKAELVEDVGLIARLQNPYNSTRTLTICNGVYGKGVLGAVMTLTDEAVRAANEQYLGERFPEGPFAMLIRVPVVSGKVLAPDLQNPETRLFEWAPDAAADAER